jgi:hypothetical protein
MRMLSAAVAGVMVWGAAGPALAQPDPGPVGPAPAVITVLPHSVEQGSSASIIASCAGGAPVVYSKLFKDGQVTGNSGHRLVVELRLRPGVTPGSHQLLLVCFIGALVLPRAFAAIEVTKASAPGPPGPQPDHRPEPRPGDLVVRISTGLGGMARSVAEHHPAG